MPPSGFAVEVSSKDEVELSRLQAETFAKLDEAKKIMQEANEIYRDAQSKRTELLRNIAAFQQELDQFEQDKRDIEQQGRADNDRLEFVQAGLDRERQELEAREMAIVIKEKAVEQKWLEAKEKFDSTNRLQMDALKNAMDIENLKAQVVLMRDQLVDKITKVDRLIQKLGLNLSN